MSDKSEGAASSPMFVETRAEAANRLRQLPIVGPEEHVDGATAHAYVSGRRSSDGSYTWMGPYPSHGLASPVTPDTPDFDGAFASARSYLQSERGDLFFKYTAAAADGRWWQDTRVEQAVQASLLEAFTMPIAPDHPPLQVLNCSRERLTEGERASVEFGLGRIVMYSQGKIASRTSGVVLGSEGLFKSEQDSGGFNPYDGVITVNLDGNYRRWRGVGVPPRYAPYFADPPAELNALSLDIAHESGHALDVTTVEEAITHGINVSDFTYTALSGRTGDFSAFQQHFGWEMTAPGDARWRINPAEAAELNELPITGYSWEHPAEDAAEVAAVDSLGADLSSAPMRQRVAREMVRLAPGETTSDMGPLRLEKLDTESFAPQRLRAITLHIGLLQPY